MIWCKPSWLINQSYQLVKDLAEIQSLSPNKNFCFNLRVFCLLKYCNRMKLDTVFVFDKEKRDDRCFFKMEDISEVSATQNF